MKKNLKNKKYLFIVIISLVLASIIAFCLINKSKHNNEDDLINISKVSEDFMEKYFEKMETVVSNYDSKNMLIVTSKDKIDEDYSAVEVVEGPNNQYFIQYENSEAKENALVNLQKNEKITVEENIVRTLDSTTYNSWGIEKMGLDKVIPIQDSKKMNDVVVAIVDSGLDESLFNSKYPGKLAGSHNFYSDGEIDDEKGHGTHIAGTIAEATGKNVKIYVAKISGKEDASIATEIYAINYIVRYKLADVINLSIGGYEYSSAEAAAISAANANNIICVAAAGNDNTSRYHYPASHSNAISVSAVDSNNNKSSYSNYNNLIDFARTWK